MKVKSIRPCGRADVYNMEVDETHDFAVEGKVIVHNCADEFRYICMARPITPPAVEPPKVKPYSPLDADDDNRYQKYSFYKI